jgi:hypothetical protein
MSSSEFLRKLSLLIENSGYDTRLLTLREKVERVMKQPDLDSWKELTEFVLHLNTDGLDELEKITVDKIKNVCAKVEAKPQLAQNMRLVLDTHYGHLAFFTGGKKSNFKENAPTIVSATTKSGEIDRAVADRIEDPEGYFKKASSYYSKKRKRK